MELTEYIKGLGSDEARKAFAIRCGTSIGHMRNVGYGQKPCGIPLAVAIERESKKAVTRRELCPDKWAEVWPELV